MSTSSESVARSRSRRPASPPAGPAKASEPVRFVRSSVSLRLRPESPVADASTAPDERGAAIGERFADGRDLGRGFRRAEARPIAKQPKVGAAEINVALELRRYFGVEIAFARYSALPRETEVETQMQRRARPSSQHRARVGQRLRAEDDRLGRELGRRSPSGFADPEAPPRRSAIRASPRARARRRPRPCGA